jgi:hypothetical protein
MPTQPPTAGTLIGRALGYALLGAVVVLFAGPVLTLAALAVLGLLCYRAYRWLFHGDRLFNGLATGSAAGTIFRKARQAIRQPALGLWRGLTVAAQWSLASVRTTWRIGRELLAGAILGAALGVLLGVPTGWDHVTVALGGGLGALLGLWNGLVSVWPRPISSLPELPTCLRNKVGTC